MRAAISSVLGRLLRSRLYVPVSLALLLALLTTTAVNIMMWQGNWTPSFSLVRSPVTITGPGVTPHNTIQAYVLGAVRTPGVYVLPDGARVHDLIAAAGGALTTADLTRVDLAALVSDGQSVYVPAVGEVVPIELGGKLDLNTASADDLHHALGLSLTIARRIIAYRAAHGSFASVSQLLLVPISRATYDRIKDLVTV
jgi:competence protein ComEA